MPVVLYERQRQILDYMAQYIQKHGYAPNLRDIANAMGLSSLATVHEHLKQLTRKGVLRVSGRGKRRVVEIVDKKMTKIDRAVRVPILGFFSEGEEITGYSDPYAFFPVAQSMFKDKTRNFALQVKGDALVADGIFDGDLLILEENPQVADGQTVIALLEEEKAVLKKFFQETTRVKLESIRASTPPIYKGTVKIQGRVLEVVRRF